MLYYRSDQERELSSYPKEYTFLTALQEGNIITFGEVSYNIHRMEYFMYNYLHKIPDKIVIANYGAEEYPILGMMEYTGELIIYTVRRYNQRNEVYYITDYGAIVFKHHIKVREMKQCIYNLKTLENQDITVFRILLGKG